MQKACARALRFRARIRAQGSGTGIPRFPKRDRSTRATTCRTTEQTKTQQYRAAAAGSTATPPRYIGCAPGSGATHPTTPHTHIYRYIAPPTNASGSAPIAWHEDWTASLHPKARPRILHAPGGPDGRAGHLRGARLHVLYRERPAGERPRRGPQAAARHSAPRPPTETPHHLRASATPPLHREQGPPSPQRRP